VQQLVPTTEQLKSAGRATESECTPTRSESIAPDSECTATEFESKTPEFEYTTTADECIAPEVRMRYTRFRKHKTWFVTEDNRVSAREAELPIEDDSR
jgi:hypothetical protein